MRRNRKKRKGVTKTPKDVTFVGSETEDVTGGVTSIAATKDFLKAEGVTYPDIIDKLTDPIWRPRLEKICSAFKARNPHDLQVCWLGNTNLSTVCELLEVTR